MNLETLTEASGRAEAARKPLVAALLRNRKESERLAKRQEELAQSARCDDRPEYLRNAESFYAARGQVVALEPRIRAAQELEYALKYLPYDWHAATPGRGQFHACFFVRSYRVEDGKPAFFDPFWIETCARRDGPEDDKCLALHATWASGGELRPGGTGPSDPLIRVRKPFGPEAEAARAPCACGASGYVVGFMELGHWSEEPLPYRQSLSVLCPACPNLMPLAERVDDALIRLYP